VTTARRLSITKVLPLFVIAVTISALGADPASAAAKKKPVATKTRCAPGSYPVVKLSNKKLKPRRDKRGRLRCITTKAKSRPVAPASSATRQLGQVADQLDRALDILPAARRALDRRLGRRGTSALVALGLNGWRRSAGVARSRAHASGSTTTTFGSEADGTAGSASLSFEEIGGDKLGVKAAGEAELSVTRDGIEKLVGKDQLPADVKGAKVKVSISFEDGPQACPTAAGVVDGRLHGAASITVTITSSSGAPTVMRLSADANMTYKAKVGEDARWTTIDDVDMQTEFQGSGTGRATQTYRGHRLGGGFGRSGIISGGDFSKSLTRDWSLIDPQKGGGVFGPKGGWNWKRGVTLSDVKSIDNVKAMASTWIATDALLLAGVEYLREVALKRGEKHWYDDEACMTLDGTATPSSLRPKGIATVTASKAKAKDGGDVPAKLTATGTASIDPGAADLAQGGTRDFKLTAPDKKGSATWTVIGISRGGKKTVSGAVPVTEDDLPASFGGTITSTFTTTGIDQNWTAGVRYDLVTRQDNPDGSILGLYELKSASVSITDDNTLPGCATYRFTSTGGTIDAGELELQIGANGSRSYGFQADVRFADAVHSPLTSPPMGCPGSFPPGLVKAFLNSRTLTSALRAVAPDGRLVQATTTDLTVNAFPAGETTASWTLAPG